MLHCQYSSMIGLPKILCGRINYLYLELPTFKWPFQMPTPFPTISKACKKKLVSLQDVLFEKVSNRKTYIFKVFTIFNNGRFQKKFVVWRIFNVYDSFRAAFLTENIYGKYSLYKFRNLPWHWPKTEVLVDYRDNRYSAISLTNNWSSKMIQVEQGLSSML